MTLYPTDSCIVALVRCEPDAGYVLWHDEHKNGYISHTFMQPHDAGGPMELYWGYRLDCTREEAIQAFCTRVSNAI